MNKIAGLAVGGKRMGGVWTPERFMADVVDTHPEMIDAMIPSRRGGFRVCRRTAITVSVDMHGC